MKKNYFSFTKGILISAALSLSLSATVVSASGTNEPEPLQGILSNVQVVETKSNIILAGPTQRQQTVTKDIAKNADIPGTITYSDNNGWYGTLSRDGIEDKGTYFRVTYKGTVYKDSN
ncbi:hypothetical protein I6N90_18050 [Paenibacillus sp. GSMTC-2017]|uniref:hypothetical protein n=1 Tax=Paenibacillus sp. GSMTC-2017 TaxID=2794350 RepID=UPI0018D9345D|nr:hypothetical protein [Paenibacillus sp. GSMTC-2017]MBH5319703.1 hypothetical protein [Paenibacillus sp. GSMTC-2017]